MAMKLADWARKHGISPQHARHLYNQGKLPHAREVSPRIVLVEDDQNLPGQGRTAIYARVSSQDQKDSLPGQTQRIAAWAALHGHTIDQVVQEVASGLKDNRKQWLALLQDPTVTTIIVEHRERATRFGFTQLQAALAAQDRCLLVAEDEELEDDLVQDMTEVLTSYCARLYGKRGAKARARKTLEQAHKDATGAPSSEEEARG